MENSQITVSQKSNHVSSVLLYGVPIVSLFIEGQERLCLAQISNTLLKQFSYNEIHNRRVALGITCVQCTPVQLEILRRAGAMPVSSRRCGMITRREAERLCKSFLGDNTPPRLPDDFAFNVQHKCAWGCRGSFLPSRYNSSRAKCIKCTYCGMFFSPNKFIFHSHRITTNDRYIQPDAANFNSWRRHMTLCGHGQNEKIIHAWEDVKAMFNGGTRKRLVSCNNNNHNSTSINRNRNTIPEKSNAIMENECISAVSCETDIKTISLREESSASIQRSVDHSYNYNTVAAGTAVVGVTAVAATVGVPFNLQRSSVLSPLQSLRNEHDLSMMPISRNFVVDYTMWQQQQTNSQHTNKKTNDNETMNGFETCTIPPWIRPETNVSTSAPKNAIRLMEHQPFNIIKSESNNTSICGILKSRQNPDSATCVNHSDFDIPSILSSSAFKPVVSAAAIVSTSLYTTRSNDSNGNVYISPPHTHPTRTTTLFTHNSVKAAATHRLATSEAIFNSSSSSFPPLLLDSIQQLCPESSEQSVSSTTLVDGFNDHSLVLTQTENADKSPLSSDPIYIESRNCQNEDDDDEVVDIETTEEDIVCPSYSTADISSLSASHSLSGSPNDDVDVDGLTTDTEDQSDLKASICSYDINITRSNFKSCTNEREKNSALNSAYAEQLEKYKKTNIEDANGLKGLSRRKCSSQHKSRLCLKNNVTKLQDDSILTSQPSLHIQQRVSFPVFLKSHLNSFRQRQRRQPSSSYVCMTQHPEIKEISLTK